MSLSDLHSLVVGPNVFQLEDYAYQEQPLVSEGKGRTGTHLTLTGTIVIEAGTTDNYDTTLFGSRGMLVISGQQITVKGLAGIEEVVLDAAECQDGGPHIQFEMVTGDTGLRKLFKFTANARRGEVDSVTSRPIDVWSSRTTIRPDGLRRIERAGELNGPGSKDQFLSITIAGLKAAYPAAAWIVGYQYESNDLGDRVVYQLSVTELLKSYPSGAGAMGVEGDATIHFDRDEQMRKVTVFAYDLLVVGDPVALATLIRPAAGVILRESLEFTSFKEKRVRIEFHLLEGGNGNALMDWQQSLEEQLEQNPILEVFSYAGGDPTYAAKPRAGQRYIQTGRAVGAGAFVMAPDPIVQKFYGPCVRKYTQLDAVQCETTWSYPLVLNSPMELSGAMLKALGRPATPVFFT